MDLDGDGQIDILSGSYSPGDIYYFAGQPDGSFAKAAKLADKDGKPLNAGRRSVPFAFDWNGDGLMDLLVGNMTGEVHLFENLGTPGKPMFGPSRPLLAAGVPLKVNAYAAITVADWDGDGLADLLVGENSGAVFWFRNTGSLGKPLLGAPATLLPPPTTSGTLEHDAEPVRSGGRPFIHVVDWNRDGVLDLLVGDCQFQTGLLPDPPLVDAETMAEARKAQVEVQARLGKLAKAPQGESPQAAEARQKQVAELRKQLSQTSAILRKGRPPMHIHGWVWLYQGSREDAAPKRL